MYHGTNVLWASDPETKLYSSFDFDGNPVPGTASYAFIYGKYGASVGKSRLYRETYSVLDSKGRALTPEIYRDAAIFKSKFHEEKVYLAMRKDGILGLYTPEGKHIHPDTTRGAIPIQMFARSINMKPEYAELVDKNIVGKFDQNDTSFYLTYEGEVLELEAYHRSIGIR